ncbi:hypothetical protein [Kineococcus rhizosphaerae]|uniref:Phenylalanyl-tRNA synthetase alpha subunit n=1 Tax=Kineococcus rhizosphaerae TaxID=559628 RepID=A0A2T0R547_9ACTN|nr:hypothetical protein [Kineococcus rhizosphaerae]PRY15837.1 phenylalanyl-tRNA synthetase alpha subunit [Kineococcus rhizosphaerae]
MDLWHALDLRDLTNPAHGPHALQLLLDDVLATLVDAWGCDLDVQRRHPVVAVADNYDHLGYAPDAVTRDARYTHYVSGAMMLRSHTSAGVPPALRALGGTPPRDLLLALPGMVHRRDTIDRLHVGTPHQVDLWRVGGKPLRVADLEEFVGLLVGAVLPGAAWRTVATVHPYTEHGLQVDVETPDGWVELAECGLAAPHVLRAAGLDPARCHGLALGMGLDRALMLRKGIDDIRVLRSGDRRVSAQLQDLLPFRPVSKNPPVRRDLSIVVDGPTDAELLGDAVRTALGPDVEDLETVEVLSSTAHDDLPVAARERLGIAPGQVNVLLRVVLRPLSRTLTDTEANVLRDRVYAAVHRGSRAQWARPGGVPRG